MKFIYYLVITILFYSCSNKSNSKTVVQSESQQHSVEEYFGPNIPPEFVRLKAIILENPQEQNKNITGVKIKIKVVEIFGYGSSFGKPIMINDTIFSSLNFGEDSIEKNAISSLKKGTSIIVEMQGNPIIQNDYSIYKLIITK
ncbi:hypothetical protein QYS48_21115 [Marivirga arenosa]|uniref:Lipoprotein n=1 Tax=Marivirga arenosa TaxID=3059076 RepID=A0AA49JDD8_9BACT|nr:hypothetical protein [Marivirga sp. ABR2-2]WKK84617.2 hypothetical protein QYS48_21115 [Marivirga sp. ABR2-2]